MIQQIQSEAQLPLPFMVDGMSSVEAKDFDRRIEEWHKRGFVVLMSSAQGDKGKTWSCVLFKPVSGMAGANLSRLEEWRGEGSTPLAAIIAAGAKYGQSALFGI